MCDQLRATAAETWTSLRLRVLGRALECEMQMQLPLDLSLGLEYLNAFAVVYGENNSVARETITDSQRTMCENITSQLGTVDADPKSARESCPCSLLVDRLMIARDAVGALQHPIFDVSLPVEAAQSLEVEDGCRVQVRVWNGSPNVGFQRTDRLCNSG